MTITVDDYFADSVQRFGYVPTETDKQRAQTLLDRVNALCVFMDVHPAMDPRPGYSTNRSGHRTRNATLELRSEGYGAALGGAHETAEGIDLDDNAGLLDDHLTDEILERFDLYREHPASTRGWCHLQIRSPRSGNRTFYP